MKHFLASIAAMASVLPATAYAQSSNSDDGNIAIDGWVEPICILGDPDPALVNLGQLAVTSGVRVGKIAAIPDHVVHLSHSFCNFAGSMLSVKATALLADNAATPQPGFARAVNYTASAIGWASGASVATTAALASGSSPDASGTGTNQPLPEVGDISVVLSNFTVPADALMVAGNYSGLVVVTLGPAVSAP